MTQDIEQPCACCQRRNPPFCLNEDDVCGTCLIEQERELATIDAPTWADVRSYRSRLLTASDWTQLPDVPLATRTKWVAIRASLRDLPENWEEADAALFALRVLESQHFA